jgi:hypothetical protein
LLFCHSNKKLIITVSLSALFFLASYLLKKILGPVLHSFSIVWMFGDHIHVV